MDASRTLRRPTSPSTPRWRDACAKPIYWPGDFIRRAAVAMRESCTNDLFTLARIALEAAIRDEIDLLELLPTPTRAPAKSKRLEAVALA